MAEGYHAETDSTDMFTAWRKVANPNKADRGESVVAGLVGYELIAPYIIARSQKRKQRELNGPPLLANQESG